MSAEYLQLADRLKQLLYDRRLSVADLTRACGVPQATISRIINGQTTRPYAKSLLALADYFEISLPELTGEKPLTNQKTNSSTALPHAALKAIPLLTRQQLSALPNLPKVITEKATVFTLDNQADSCFAFQMDDSSMDPIFPSGTLLILSMTKIAQDRHFVLVKIAHSGDFVFRQLLVDGDRRFLKAFNSDLPPRQLDQHDQVMAVLVEMRQVF